MAPPPCSSASYSLCQYLHVAASFTSSQWCIPSRLRTINTRNGALLTGRDVLDALQTREQAREREVVHKEALRIQREHKAATKAAAKAKKRVGEEERRGLRACRVERMRPLQDN